MKNAVMAGILLVLCAALIFTTHKTNKDNLTKAYQEGFGHAYLAGKNCPYDGLDKFVDCAIDFVNRSRFKPTTQ